MPEFDLAYKIPGPGRFEIIRMLHRKRDNLPIELLEQPILLQKNDIRTASPIVIVIDRKKRPHYFFPDFI